MPGYFGSMASSRAVDEVHTLSWSQVTEVAAAAAVAAVVDDMESDRMLNTLVRKAGAEERCLSSMRSVEGSPTGKIGFARLDVKIIREGEKERGVRRRGLFTNRTIELHTTVGT